MNGFRTLAFAAGALALSAAAPAFAQGWADPGYASGWHDGQGRGYGPAPYGYSAYGVDTGVTDIAVCPPGYHLGRAPGLCWPD
jgi:hypothetical protein